MLKNVQIYVFNFFFVKVLFDDIENFLVFQSFFADIEYLHVFPQNKFVRNFQLLVVKVYFIPFGYIFNILFIWLIVHWFWFVKSHSLDSDIFFNYRVSDFVNDAHQLKHFFAQTTVLSLIFNLFLERSQLEFKSCETLVFRVDDELKIFLLFLQFVFQNVDFFLILFKSCFLVLPKGNSTYFCSSGPTSKLRRLEIYVYSDMFLFYNPSLWFL